MGELSKLTLNPGGKVTGEMTVDPSVVPLMRENTRIELRNPKLSLSDANISSLLTGKTFELVPGDGEPRSEFVVVPGEKALLHEANALTLTLTAPESYGIEPGQPLILHGVKIGRSLSAIYPVKACHSPSRLNRSTGIWYRATVNSWSTAGWMSKSALTA